MNANVYLGFCRGRTTNRVGVLQFDPIGWVVKLLNQSYYKPSTHVFFIGQTEAALAKDDSAFLVIGNGPAFKFRARRE